MNLTQLYDQFDEAQRLNRGAASRVEFLTTCHFIDPLIKPGIRILDIGAGAGAYSLRYAGQGCAVTAVEPVERNLDGLMRGVRPCMDIRPILGDDAYLDQLPENSFDIVLCLGPLYHLEQDARRLECIRRAKRVCKPGGALFFAYLSNDMVFVTEAILYQKDPLRGQNYRPDFSLEPGPFTFLTPPQAQSLLAQAGLNQTRHFAADGLAELLAQQINGWDQRQFDQWMKFHLYACQKPELLGASNHIVLQAEKPYP